MLRINSREGGEGEREIGADNDPSYIESQLSFYYVQWQDIKTYFPGLRSRKA